MKIQDLNFKWFIFYKIYYIQYTILGSKPFFNSNIYRIVNSIANLINLDSKWISIYNITQLFFFTTIENFWLKILSTAKFTFYIHNP